MDHVEDRFDWDRQYFHKIKRLIARNHPIEQILYEFGCSCLQYYHFNFIYLIYQALYGYLSLGHVSIEILKQSE
jgi:hypothetical protein